MSNDEGRRHGERLAAGLALLALLVVFFREAVFEDRLLGPADLVFTTPAFADAAPPGFTRPGNPLLFDQTYQFLPWRRFAWEALRAGRLPLWNPHSLAGTPFVATMGSAVFYPLNLLHTLLPFARGFVWTAITRLWIAGMATYALSRGYGLPVAAAATTGVSFMLCAFLVVWLQHPHTNVVVWLPVLALLVERLLGARTPGARRRFVALAAAVVGIAATGGHAESLLYIVLASAAYTFARWQHAGRPRGVVGAFALATGLGAALAAVQLLPFLEWLPLSAEFGRRHGAGVRLVDPSFWRELCWLPVALFPEALGNPTAQHPYHAFLPWGNYNEGALYVGTLPLIGAVVAVMQGARHPGPARTWVLVTALSLGLAFRLPLLEGLNTLPILRLANPARLRCVASLGLTVLAGFGVAAVLATDPDARRRAERLWLRVAAVIVALGALALVGGALVLPHAQGWILTVGRRLVEAKYATLSAPGKPLGAFLADLEGLVGDMIAAYRPTHPAMYAPALWALAGGALILATRSRLRVRGAALVVVVTLDLFAFGRGYNPSVPLAEAYPRPAALAGLGTSELPAPRVTAVQQAMLPDAHLFFGLYDIRGMDFPIGWYDAYLRLAPDWVPWLAYGVLLRGVDSPLLRVLNVGEVVAEDGDLAARPGLEVRPAGAVVVGRVLEPWPRSFVVHAAVLARDDSEAARLLAADPAAVYRRVVLSNGPAPAPLSLPAGGAAWRPVRALRYAPERSAWAVADGAAGYLVSTDTYYPGWRAYLDGRPTALHRANLAFRAVPVPPGTHVVEFRYEPWSVRLGVAVSLLATMVVAWLLWSARRAGAAA